jgi:UDP-N-acetylglucosamine 3-dehydrogenase
MNVLRVGVIGYGQIGRHHARNLAAIPGVHFAGVAEYDAGARAEARERGFEVFESASELLAQHLDAVVVAVPTGYHEAVAAECIDAGCSVLVEKPLAPTLGAAKRIIARAASAGVLLMVGYVERYNPAIVATREFLESESLGDLISVSARRVGVMPPRIKDANVIVDIGVHDIDVVAFITNARLNLVSARGGMAVLEDRIDFATLMLDAAGAVVTIDANWITPVKIRELSITGTHGFCHVDYITQSARFAAGQSFEVPADYESLLAQYERGTMVDLPVVKREPLAVELEAFINAIRGLGELPDPALALASLRIAEEASAMIGSVRPLAARRLAPAPVTAARRA